MDWTIFRDQIWNFVGAIVAILAIFAAIMIYFLQRGKKSISYDIVSKSSLLTTKEKLEGRIKVFYNDQEIQNVKLIEIMIINSGNIGIPVEDYERPLKFIFSEGSNVLTAEITESNPKSLITTLNLNRNEVTVKPVLMNRKDYIKFKAIISNYGEDILKTDLRVKDVKDIRRIGDNNRFFVFIIIGIVFSVIGVIFTPSERKGNIEPTDLVGYLALFVSYVFMLVGLIKSKSIYKYKVILRKILRRI